MATLVVSAHGLCVSGLRAGTLRSALRAMREYTHDPHGLAAETLAVQIRARGVPVSLRVATGAIVVHEACGAVHLGRNWNARTSKRQEYPVGKGLVGYTELRQCDCGSSLTLASLQLFGP